MAYLQVLAPDQIMTFAERPFGNANKHKGLGHRHRRSKAISIDCSNFSHEAFKKSEAIRMLPENSVEEWKHENNRAESRKRSVDIRSPGAINSKKIQDDTSYLKCRSNISVAEKLDFCAQEEQKSAEETPDNALQKNKAVSFNESEEIIPVAEVQGHSGWLSRNDYRAFMKENELNLFELDFGPNEHKVSGPVLQHFSPPKKMDLDFGRIGPTALTVNLENDEHIDIPDLLVREEKDESKLILVENNVSIRSPEKKHRKMTHSVSALSSLKSDSGRHGGLFRSYSFSQNGGSNEVGMLDEGVKFDDEKTDKTRTTYPDLDSMVITDQIVSPKHNESPFRKLFSIMSPIPSSFRSPRKKDIITSPVFRSLDQISENNSIAGEVSTSLRKGFHNRMLSVPVKLEKSKHSDNDMIRSKKTKSKEKKSHEKRHSRAGSRLFGTKNVIPMTKNQSADNIGPLSAPITKTEFQIAAGPIHESISSGGCGAPGPLIDSGSLSLRHKECQGLRKRLSTLFKKS